MEASRSDVSFRDASNFMSSAGSDADQQTAHINLSTGANTNSSDHISHTRLGSFCCRGQEGLGSDLEALELPDVAI